MKKKYLQPEAEIVYLSEEIIRTSLDKNETEPMPLFADKDGFNF